ncbi:YpfB family protein [Pseudalkalibacillus sp. SCS-8]|uniref:YpfB family protein n=1 Tax=Pseudalkalibacillus nanhaiensis TaxID=3115291 RepID=UPI0032DAADB5
MKTIERIIMKVIICQVIFMIVGQLLVLQTGIGSYLNRVYQYEGILSGQRGETVETIDHSNDLWYHERVEKDLKK